MCNMQQREYIIVIVLKVHTVNQLCDNFVISLLQYIASLLVIRSKFSYLCRHSWRAECIGRAWAFSPFPGRVRRLRFVSRWKDRPAPNAPFEPPKEPRKSAHPSGSRSRLRFRKTSLGGKSDCRVPGLISGDDSCPADPICPSFWIMNLQIT